ncbi:protein-glutamate O-methyltransferase CheR [soil metagenome]
MQDIEIAEIRKLTEVIKNNYDYDFSNYAMSSFKRRIQRIMEIYSFNSVDSLVKRVKNDKPFFSDFITNITVNVTEMFRDPSFWRELRDTVLPDLLHPNKKLTIWHAGCSSGEEVFSMCIMLREMGVLEQVKIIATDLDEVILEKAIKGQYQLKSMDLNEKNYVRFIGKRILPDYYKEENGLVQMDQTLLKNVSFRKHDLVNGKMNYKFDLILCRNVMIYFNQSLQNEVLKKLYESLYKNGHLIIGSKESLIWSEIASKFTAINSEEKIFKKIKD